MHAPLPPQSASAAQSLRQRPSAPVFTDPSGQAGGRNGNLSGYVTADAIDDGGWRQDSPSRLRRVYADVGGGPNACMLGSDGCVYSTQTPNVGAWAAPVHRPPSI